MFKKEYLKTVIHHIKNYKLNSVFVKNFKSIFIVFLIPMLFITWFIYSTSQNKSDNEIKEMSSASLYQVREAADTVISSAKSMIIKISLSQNSDSFFYSENFSNISENSVDEISTLANNYMNIFSYIDSILLYSDRNKYIINHNGAIPCEEYDDITWLQDFEALSDKGAVVFPRKYNNMYPYYISIIYPVFNSNNEKLGCGLININIEELKSFITNSQEEKESFLFIIDNNDKILYSNTGSMIAMDATELAIYDLIYEHDIYSGECFYNDEASIITVVSSENFPFKYVSIIPQSFFSDKNPQLALSILGIILIAFIASIILTLIVSFKTYEPLKTIISFIDKPESYLGNKIGNDDEIQYIIKSMLSTIQKNNEMESLLEKRLIMLQHAQAKTLQAQINPHFLYNTLENLNMLAVDLLGSSNRISDIVISLSKLFRISADTKNYIVTLKDEIEYSKEYIKILKIRCGNKFDVVWDIPDVLLNKLTVKLCLQPILENAVNHGIKFLDKPGIIHIIGKENSENIFLTITDNGKGIKPAERIRFNKELKQQYTAEIDHIGLKNTNQRIKFIFGQQYGIIIDEEITEGTKINIILPNIDTLKDSENEK